MRNKIIKLEKSADTKEIDGVLRIKGILNTNHVLGDSDLDIFLNQKPTIEEFNPDGLKYIAMMTDGVHNCFDG